MSATHDTVPETGASKSRYRRDLTGLYHISQILTSDVPQKQMLAEVLDLMAREIGLIRGTILLVSPDGGELMIEAAHGLTPRERSQVRYQIGEGIVGNVVATGRAALVPSVAGEPRFLDRLHQRRQQDPGKDTSFICVPILAGSEIIGALAADLPLSEPDALKENSRVLSVIASMIAKDVHSRRLSEMERQRFEEENLRLREELEDRFRPENIIGNSNAMREVYRQIYQVAPSDATVLIRGESGTGKELVAHAIHYASPRAKGPFVKVNCAALPENLVESELFGHEKGAFTSAIQSRKGRLEEADGGTLFLDEIGDFSLATQVKLLRVLQEKEFERVGSNETRKSNVRILCATHRDLEQLVETTAFRQDLYYRINVFPIVMPPLRNRKDDISLLCDHFIERYAGRMSKDVRRITTPAINMMMSYHWPGNVRELENSIERAVLLSSDGVIHAHHLPPTLQTSDASDTIGAGSLEDRVALFERDIIVDALKRSSGNISSAARDLGTTSRILGYRAKQLEIDYRRFRPRAG